MDVDSEGDDATDQFVSVKRVRSYFPEAWLWEDKQTEYGLKLYQYYTKQFCVDVRNIL